MDMTTAPSTQDGLKWYFSVSEGSLSFRHYDWPGMILAAVRSARARTNLRPHLLYDGSPNEFTKELEAQGVRIIPHRVGFYDALEAFSTSKPKGWLEIAAGAFLRLDIPEVETEDECVLYTDGDVLFLQNPDFFRIRPPTWFAAAPQVGTSYDDMNSGVMLINVPAMRAEHQELVNFIRNHLDLGLDQEVLRVFYADRYDLLDTTLNWKPYWGVDPKAQIVHFHGPKPAAVRRLLHQTDALVDRSWRELFDMNRDAYRHYLELWDSFAGAPSITCYVDGIADGWLKGWAVHDSNPYEPVSLAVLIDGTQVDTIQCTLQRPDVLAAGFGTEHCGFLRDTLKRNQKGSKCRLGLAESRFRTPVKMHFQGQVVTTIDLPAA